MATTSNVNEGKWSLAPEISEEMKIKIILLSFNIMLLTILFFYSCREGANDSFYSKSCGYDCKKIPLINPYFLGSTTGIDGIW